MSESDPRRVFVEQQRVTNEVIKEVRDKLGLELEDKCRSEYDKRKVCIDFESNDEILTEFGNLVFNREWVTDEKITNDSLEVMPFGSFDIHITANGCDKSDYQNFVCGNCDTWKLKDEKNNEYYCPICD